MRNMYWEHNIYDTFRCYNKSVNKTEKVSVYVSRDRVLNKINTHTHIYTCLYIGSW